MSGEEIRFSHGGGEVKFVKGKKVKNEIKNNEVRKAFDKLFNAIANSDGNKELSDVEMKMVKDLKTIFSLSGENVEKDGALILDNIDKEIAEEFANSGKKISEFIEGKLRDIKVKQDNDATINEALAAIPEIVDDIVKNGFPHLQNKGTISEEKLEKKQISTSNSKSVVTQEAKNASFNEYIKLLKGHYDKTALKEQYTKTVEYQKGKYLYNIAKEALEAEGIEKPTAKQINERIAQIALVNDIKDVNNVPQDKFPLRVGTGASIVEEVPLETPKVPVPTETVPVISPEGGLVVKPDVDLKDWEANEDAEDPDGVDLNGGSLTTYTQASGNDTKTKYVYEKDGVKVEADSVETLKEQIKTIKEALENVTAGTTVPEDSETDEAKAARVAKFQEGIEALLALGTESAVNVAQQKLAENKAVAPDFYAEKAVAILKSGNPSLIEQMLGADGAKFAETVNNNPKVQQALGEVVKYLNDKFNNDEYLTLDEQKIKAILDKCVEKDGVQVGAEAAVPAQDATETTPAVEKKDKVFAKQMVTDKEGNSYYKAKLDVADGNFKDVEFKAKDKDQLNEFLLDLEAANMISDKDQADEAMTDLFKKYVEMENVDPELLKSIVAQAPKLKADAETVKNLVANSNLDVIYAMDTSHFENVQDNPGKQVKASNAKDEVAAAIRTSIEAIMGDSALRALPENAKYLDKIKGIEIPADSTAIIKSPDLNDYTPTQEEVPTGEKDANGNEIKVTVTKYTKEGQADVFMVQPSNAIDGADPIDLYASSKDEAIKMYTDFKAIGGINYDATTPEAKRENLEIMMKRQEKFPENYEVLLGIVGDSKSDYFDKNDPDAKALVQKLLLTRDAGIVKILTQKFKAGSATDCEVDGTLFVNDPVALKTLAAMFKEIRDLENQGVRLTPEQIALKNELEYSVVKMEAKVDNGNVLRFDGEGNLAVHNADESGDKCGAVAANSTLAEQYNYEKLMNDPILSKDKYALATWLTTDIIITKEDADKLFSLDNQSIDAELLSYVQFENFDASMPVEDEKAVQDAYVAKAKTLFANMGKVGDTEQLDPANARYLKTILEKIDSISEVGEGGVDPDKAVIAEILGNFFTTTGEGENAVTTINNFRRFTYEEMEGLANAVAEYGIDAQKTALANMITPEEMEYGQFVSAIEVAELHNSTHSRYADIANGMTAKEDVLAFIEKMEVPARHTPFDKIMEKFGNEPEIVTKLLEKISIANCMSETTRKALVAKLINTEGNVEIPSGVNVSNLRYLLPQEAAATDGEKATPEVKMDANEVKLFKKIVEQEKDIVNLYNLFNKAKQTKNLQDLVEKRVENLADENKTNAEVLLRIVRSFPKIALTKLLNIKLSDIVGKDYYKTALVDFVKAEIAPSNKPTDEQVKAAFDNGWFEAENRTKTYYDYGKTIVGYLNGLGTSDAFWTDSKDVNKINETTIVDVIDGFYDGRSSNYATDGLVTYMLDDGVSKAITNRYVKALMRKAVELGLDKTTEFTNLQQFFLGETVLSVPDGADKVTQIFAKSAHDQAGKAEYSKTEASTLDSYVDSLLAKIKLWTGRV